MAGRARENMDNWDRLRLLLIVALIATGGIYWGSALLEGHRPQSPQPSPAGLLPATASSTFAKNDQGLAVKLGNPNEGATFIPNANSTRKDITDRLPQ